MTYEKWEEIINKITSEFSVIDQGKETESEHEEYEFIEFSRDGMLIRLELNIYSKLLTSKSLYSKRAGSVAIEKKEYDNSEKIYSMSAFLFDESMNNWKEIDADMF